MVTYLTISYSYTCAHFDENTWCILISPLHISCDKFVTKVWCRWENAHSPRWSFTWFHDSKIPPKKWESSMKIDGIPQNIPQVLGSKMIKITIPRQIIWYSTPSLGNTSNILDPQETHQMEVSWVIGVPPVLIIHVYGIFHEMNHPAIAIGLPPLNHYPQDHPISSLYFMFNSFLIPLIPT